MSDKKPTSAEITIPYDSFQLCGLVAWIEANGYKPHLLIQTAHPGVQLPPQCMAKKQDIINVASAACKNMMWNNDRLETNSRFNGKDFKLIIPYRSVVALNFAGTDEWIPMPWTAVVGSPQEAERLAPSVAVVHKPVEELAPPPAEVSLNQDGTAPVETAAVSGENGSTVHHVDFSRGRQQK